MPGTGAPSPSAPARPARRPARVAAACAPSRSPRASAPGSARLRAPRSSAPRAPPPDRARERRRQLDAQPRARPCVGRGRRSICGAFLFTLTCIQNQRRTCAVKPTSARPTPGTSPTDGRYSSATSTGARVKLNSRPAMPGHADAHVPPPVGIADAAAETEIPVDVEIRRADQRRHLEQVVEAQARCRRCGRTDPDRPSNRLPQKPSTPWNAPGPAISFPDTPASRPCPTRCRVRTRCAADPQACARDGASVSARRSVATKTSADFHICDNRTPSPRGRLTSAAMDESKQVFIGTDCGATMSKVGGVWADGTTISTKLLQRPTNAQKGRDAVVAGLDRRDRRIPGAERPHAGRRSAASAWRSPGRTCATACSATPRTCRPASRAGTSTPTTARRWRRRPAARCRWSWATTAPSAASARRSACAARARAAC